MGNDPHEQTVIYAALIGLMAEQHDSVCRAGVALYTDAIRKRIEPKDLDMDEALIALGIAQYSEDEVADDGSPVIEYMTLEDIAEWVGE